MIIKSLIRPGTSDLVDLYMRQKRTDKWMANDTSCGVGYAPLSDLENTVLHVEERLNATSRKQHSEIGQDIKVMGMRQGNDIDLTVAVPMISQHIRDMRSYEQAKQWVQNNVEEHIGLQGNTFSISVKTADDPQADSIYLTVTGTSVESGDDGEGGRGNRGKPAR